MLRNRFLGVMGSFGRLDLRATDLLVGDVSNGRGQTLNLGAQGLDRVREMELCRAVPVLDFSSSPILGIAVPFLELALKLVAAPPNDG